MYRVMIVDDEVHAINMIKSQINWDEYDLELVGTACNGQDALEKMDSCRPDLIFTDIKMPVMDGLELMKQAQGRAKFVVMSGYSDFEYVRTSMRLGALNYILKPVSQVELSETLAECINILEQQAPVKTSASQPSRALIDYTLWRLLHGQLSVTELREKSKLLDLRLRSLQAVIALFHLSEHDRGTVSLEKIYQCVTETLLQQFHGYPFMDTNDNLVLILNFDTFEPDHQQVYDAIAQCAQALQALLQISSVPTAVGHFVSNAMELQSSYRAARNLQQYHFLMSHVPVLHTELPLKNTDPREYHAPNPLTVLTLLQNRDEEALKACLLSSFSMESQEATGDDRCHLIETSSILLSAAELNHLPSDTISALRTSFLDNLRRAVTALDAVQALTQLSHQVLHGVQGDTPAYSPKIESVMEKIRCQYADCNFSLKTLSNDLNVNSAYLGRQFRLETGQFFSDYLNNYRIKKAQALFLSTQMTASEIGEAVGYTTANYFYSIFKKITGISTSNYRKSMEPIQV